MQHKILSYQAAFGPIRWPDGFKEELEGKSLEEQVRCYAWVKDTFCGGAPSHRELAELCMEHPHWSDYVEPLLDTDAVLVKDGFVVGASHKEYRYDNEKDTFVGSYLYILPYQKYCYDSSSDNNGAGYKERRWYKYLMCLPADHKLW